MIYTMESRIRYSETDMTGTLITQALIDYFQDTATFHGEDNGLPMTMLARHHLTWVLAGWQVRIYRMPVLGDKVQLNTWAYKFGLSLGYRRFSMTDDKGELLAEADARYMLLNTEKNAPSDVPEWMAEGYGLDKRPLQAKLKGRKIALPETGEEQPAVKVTVQMLDTNHHVNNAQFIALAERYLPDDFTCNTFRVQYKKQAFLGDVFIPVVYRCENGCAVALKSEDGEEYFTGEWLEDA